MASPKLSAAVLIQSLVAGGPVHSPAWVARAEQPPADELACTVYSSLFWSTSVKNGVAHATELPVRSHVDPLPFKVAPSIDRDGDRWVTEVPDGWMVGFDAGEFGGGLWWFNRDGTSSRRIRPAFRAPAHPDDPFRAENVVGLPVVGGERLVLMGLDHLVGRSGRIFRLARAAAVWTLNSAAVLDSSPDVWFVDGDRLLFLTDSGLWSADPKGNATRLHPIELGEFAATALVRAPDNALYIGLRHYVLKIEETDGKWRQTWFTPAACKKVELKRGRCECVQ